MDAPSLNCDWFDTIYVCEPSHDFSTLSEHTSRIKYVTSGFDDQDIVIKIIAESFAEFNPEKDAFLPAGKTFMNFIIGIVLGKLFPDTEINMGVYKNKEYSFIKIRVGEIDDETT